mmetsp:Transcript_17367/g.47414  ORF Transcript_17367/g.47414 Transcript_17367/m.47414 type:complete len:232 (+) Transcript_17367:233-928(+)
MLRIACDNCCFVVISVLLFGQSARLAIFIGWRRRGRFLGGTSGREFLQTISKQKETQHEGNPSGKVQVANGGSGSPFAPSKCNESDTKGPQNQENSSKSQLNHGGHDRFHNHKQDRQCHEKGDDAERNGKVGAFAIVGSGEGAAVVAARDRRGFMNAHGRAHDDQTTGGQKEPLQLLAGRISHVKGQLFSDQGQHQKDGHDKGNPGKEIQVGIVHVRSHHGNGIVGFHHDG